MILFVTLKETYTFFYEGIFPVIRGRCNLKRSRRTVIFLPVYKISSLKITLPKTLQLKTLDFLQQTITMNENAQWQMINDSVLFALSSGFSVSLFHFYLKKNRLEVHCSVFLLFSRGIDHFICFSRIVFIGDSLGHVIFNSFPVGSHSLGHVICLLIYFRLAAMLLNILKCISMFILLPLTLPSGAYQC